MKIKELFLFVFARACRAVRYSRNLIAYCRFSLLSDCATFYQGITHVQKPSLLRYFMIVSDLNSE